MKSALSIENPFVSVIIPNYNHAQYLDERILSVLNQTYQDYELIILDDCSTDNSRDIIEKYRYYPHVTNIVYNDVNSGMTFKQWDKGLKLAKGKLVWFAESDDSCYPTLLEVLVGEFERNEKCVLAYCRSLVYSTAIEQENVVTSGRSFSLSGEKFIKYFMSCNNSVLNASSALFKKENAQMMSKDYYNFKGAGDRLFWIHLAETGDVSIVTKRLNYFRQHGANSTSRYYYYGINQKEDKRILDYIFEKGYIGKFMMYLSKIRYCNSQVVGRSFASKEIKEDIERCWNITSIDLMWIRIYRVCYSFIKKIGVV